MAMTLDKNKILDAARIVFARHGFRKASLSDIVRPLGVAKTAIYHHFPGGKGELIHEVLRREENILLNLMEQTIAGISDPREQLRSLILGKLKHFHSLRELLDVPHDVGEEMARIYDDHERSFHMKERAIICSLIRRGQDDGIFRLMDPDRLAKGVQIVLHRLEVPLVFDMKTAEDMEREVDDLLDILFYGIINPSFGSGSETSVGE